MPILLGSQSEFVAQYEGVPEKKKSFCKNRWIFWE